ncbi:hypothetical protein HELRODRAFT_159670 [Helobdella robusta]|uniref:Laminin G domain-containing protein n=1 Tax=Helobdella robusta TaxID=6412 RepID=T1EPA6_HELRO|nr:hypothetical protein HELRODRAFT_159670 [Helobdella robusta]ESO13071.1 hypothetical protein HELRODRAFT_159670 [Helobdella robusta]
MCIAIVKNHKHNTVISTDNVISILSSSSPTHQFQAIISSSSIFIFTTRAFKTTYDVCNNKYHTINMMINSAGVTLSVDSIYQESKQFDSTFAYAAPLSVPIYLGGVKDPLWNIPGVFSSTSMLGCIQRS